MFWKINPQQIFSCLQSIDARYWGSAERSLGGRRETPVRRRKFIGKEMKWLRLHPHLALILCLFSFQGVAKDLSVASPRKF